MAATTSETVPSATFGSPGTRQVELKPTRSATAASRTALRALIQRDLVVLWKHKIEFVVRLSLCLSEDRTRHRRRQLA
jgi:hypothetical protein